MKKIIFLFIAMIFSACSPQVTEPPTATSTPLPTQTPIPTPTLHPEFIELQNTINAENGFVLTNDGTIEHNGEIVPNITVTADGNYVLVVGEEMIMFAPDEVTLDPEKGIIPNGYELNENGEWVEAVSEAELAAIADFEQNGLVFDTENYDVVEEGDKVTVTDIETGEVLYIDGKFDLHFVQEALAESGELVPTKYKPNPNGSFKNTAPNEMTMQYSVPLLREFRIEYEKIHGVEPADKKLSGFNELLLDPVNLNIWGLVYSVNWKDPKADAYLVFEQMIDGNNQVAWIKILPISSDEILAYWNDQEE